MAETGLRSPLGRARGYGSAKEGVSHFWVQRVSAVALVPLSLWFVFAVAQLQVLSALDVQAWVRQPLTAVMLVLFIPCLFYHSMLGLQVVVEDYVGHEGAKLVTLLLLKFAHAVAAAAGVFAVLKVALGS